MNGKDEALPGEELLGGRLAVPAAEPRRRPLLPHLAAVLRVELGPLRLRLLLADLVARLLPHMGLSRLRTLVYRAAGVSIGRRSLVGGRLHLVGPGNVAGRLRIGERCWISGPLHADLNAEITIGDGVTLGNHVVLITADHQLGPSHQRAGPVRPRPIVIGDGAWLAAGVTVLPGAVVGAGTVVGAGSVVRGALPPDVLAAGVPARPVRQLPR